MNSVNSVQIAAYLRTACSVLNFDIGELWLARKTPGWCQRFCYFYLTFDITPINDIFNVGERPTLKFLQLYTSPTYDDFHSLLIRPDTNSLKNDDDKHRISPIVRKPYNVHFIIFFSDLDTLIDLSWSL
jgi:hypothetical protein